MQKNSSKSDNYLKKSILSKFMLSIGLINRDNLLIFKFQNFKIDLKDNFVNN